MANPITWQTINSNIDVDGFSRALARAGQGVSTGITGLQDILKGEQQLREANFNNTVNNSTQDFLNKMSQYSPEQLQQAMQDGSIDQLRSGYGVNLDPTKTNGAALQQLLQGKQQQVLSQNQFDDGMAERASLGIQNQLNEAINNGDLITAASLKAQLPKHLQSGFADRIDSVGDAQLNNEINSLIATGKFSEAETKIKQASKDRDTSTQTSALTSARDQYTQKQVLNAQRNVEPEYQRRLKERNDATKAFIRNELRLPADLSGASAEQLARFDEFNSSYGNLTRKSVEQELVSPILEQYRNTPGYAPAFENELRLLRESENDGLHPGDVAEVRNQIDSALVAAKNNGNFYAQDENRNPSRESIDAMFNSVAKGNPVFEDLDGKDRQKIAKNLTKLAIDGVRIGDRKVPVPQSILKTMLEGADSGIGWFNGDSLETAVKGIMEESGIASQWEEMEQIQQHERDLLRSYKEASGIANPLYLTGVENNRKTAEDVLRKAAQKAAEAEKAKADEAAKKVRDKEAYNKLPPAPFGQAVASDDVAVFLEKMAETKNKLDNPGYEQEQLDKKAALEARLKELVQKSKERR